LANLPQPVPVSADLTDSLIPTLVITSLVDNITVQNTVVNQGNCLSTDDTPGPQEKFIPKTLKFGEFLPVRLGCLKVLEVVVSTDLGDYSFTWNK